MQDRQNSLYETAAPHAPGAAAPPPLQAPAKAPKRNYLFILMVLFIGYVTIGELVLPEPIRFTRIIGERTANINELIIEGTTEAEAEKQRQTIEASIEAEAQKQRRIIEESIEAEALKNRRIIEESIEAEALKQRRITEENAQALADAERLKIEETAYAQAVAACMQQRAQIAQQAYAECLKDRDRTGPTCDFYRDELLNSACE